MRPIATELGRRIPRCNRTSVDSLYCTDRGVRSESGHRSRLCSLSLAPTPSLFHALWGVQNVGFQNVLWTLRSGSKNMLLNLVSLLVDTLELIPAIKDYLNHANLANIIR